MILVPLALAPGIGVPQQNLVVGDRYGHIAWTIIGRVPRAWAEGRNDGSSPWLAFEDYPRIVDPSGGRLWTANSRATDDTRPELAIGGDEAILGAEYDLGARARQIREGLFALERAAAPADMLAIQLDDRARFLSRWREFLLAQMDATIAESEALCGRLAQCTWAFENGPWVELCLFYRGWRSIAWCSKHGRLPI